MCTIAPPPALGHHLRYALPHQERAREVDAEHPLPLVLREVEERAVMIDSRTVDENIDPRPASLSRFYHPADRLPFRHIGRERPGCSTRLADRGGHRIDLGGRTGNHEHLRSLRCESSGRRLADPATTPGDNHRFAAEPVRNHEAS